MILYLILAALVGLVIVAGFFGYQQVALRQLSRNRLFMSIDDDNPADETPNGPLTRWFVRAGYRSSHAVTTFFVVSVLFSLLALSVPIAFYASGLFAIGLEGLAEIPGGVGDILLPLLYLAPWIGFFVIASIPVLVVRARRRERVRQVEQDLPIFLELLATLSESGLGFDAALDRILSTQSTDRALSSEFLSFQTELLAGRPRIAALRRLAGRLNVMSVNILVAALVQAEQIGSGVATVLRHQADDLRSRRREQTLAKAMSLPSKLVVPLVVCFLPGIFVATLGPIFYQFFQFAEGLMRLRPNL